MFKALKRTALILGFALGLPSVAMAQAFETNATAAWVIDHNTGQILLDHNADLPLPPASMSKIMTLNMTFEALEDGRLSLDTVLPVSAHAMSLGGSTMFLNTRDRVSVEDLIRGIIVLSGNDATVVLAEALSPDGSEEGFAALMTERARQLGMMNSTFRNASGWPSPGHVMSMHDLGILAERLITEFPQYYSYFSEREFAFDGRAPDNRFNRNALLPLNIGADGLKTGHTEEAGYGLVGSAVQGDRRVTFVVSGLQSAQQRATESERIVNWAFRQFAERTLVEQGSVVARADVFMGDSPDVGLTVAEDLTMLLPALATLGEGVQADVVYDGPLEAPIAQGQQIAELVIALEGFEDRRVPLVAAEAVEQGGIISRIGAAAETVLRNFLSNTPMDDQS